MNRTVKDKIDMDERMNIYNRALAMMIAPKVVDLVNNHVIPKSAFSEKKYFERILIDAFGSKARCYSDKLKIERAKFKDYPDIEIVLLHTPSSKSVGQSDIIAFVSSGSRQADVYILEYSLNNRFAVCQWKDKQHLNNGNAGDKIEFVKKIVALYSDIQSKEEGPFDELDLKHRLAKEIGVCVENLDLYMTVFQEKVTMEMQGVDSSGLDSRIQDKEEWMRYCQWEISQARKRMSSEEMKDSYKLFEYMVDRDRSRMN